VVNITTLKSLPAKKPNMLKEAMLNEQTETTKVPHQLKYIDGNGTSCEIWTWKTSGAHGTKDALLYANDMLNEMQSQCLEDYPKIQHHLFRRGLMDAAALYWKDAEQSVGGNNSNQLVYTKTTLMKTVFAWIAKFARKQERNQLIEYLKTGV
jgi:hypothetical protein